MSVLDILRERGFVENTTHEAELENYLNGDSVSCYIGFDPTGSSLHVGHLLPIMSLAHMQRCGHRPIALVGGGTGLIGDPSGKTEMRKLITKEDVEENKKGIKKQLSHFLDFSDGRAALMDNADWLTDLGYIDFLRDIGRHFSVNRMIKAESYKMRLDSDEGLSFIEFNYMLLQAYDFLELFKGNGCRLQMGGSDQWGNILAGVELVRRCCHEAAYGITFPLITTSTGAKMGKTAKGAVWLDPERTSPYEYFQFWINTDDLDVSRFLRLFTFLPVEEIVEVDKLSGSDLNSAKNILAFEATVLAHGQDEAVKAFEAAQNMFGARSIPDGLLKTSSIPRDAAVAEKIEMPSTIVSGEQVQKGISASDLFYIAGLVKSKGEARRLIDQGGAYVNNERVSSFDQLIGTGFFEKNEVVLRAGKKRYHRIVVSD